MAALSDIPLLIHQLLTICFFKHLGSLQLSFQLSSDAKRERERDSGKWRRGGPQALPTVSHGLCNKQTCHPALRLVCDCLAERSARDLRLRGVRGRLLCSSDRESGCVSVVRSPQKGCLRRRSTFLWGRPGNHPLNCAS